MEETKQFRDDVEKMHENADPVDSEELEGIVNILEANLEKLKQGIEEPLVNSL
jgi:hypothetical protein